MSYVKLVSPIILILGINVSFKTYLKPQKVAAYNVLRTTIVLFSTVL